MLFEHGFRYSCWEDKWIKNDKSVVVDEDFVKFGGKSYKKEEAIESLFEFID